MGDDLTHSICLIERRKLEFNPLTPCNAANAIFRDVPDYPPACYHPLWFKMSFWIIPRVPFAISASMDRSSMTITFIPMASSMRLTSLPVLLVAGFRAVSGMSTFIVTPLSGCQLALCLSRVIVFVV